MKSNELRIGNLVSIYNIVHLVDEVHEKGIFAEKVQESVCQKDWFNFDEVKPIELNEKWLHNLGFEKQIDKTQIDGIEMKLQINGIGRDGTWFSSCGTRNGSIAVLCLCRGNYFSKNIFYVHEFQNLYHALKGEDFELS
jgi:hypothetical protein